MLNLEIPEIEFYDEVANEFRTIKAQKLSLEHSLVSIEKWEEKHNKPFLAKDPPKTEEETIDYIRCMTITQNVDPVVYSHLPPDTYEKISEYINAPMTATWFSEEENRRFNKEIITAEIVYYWMIALNIPFECRKWHFNKLITLVRVCNIKSDPDKHKKKMPINKLMSRNRALNEARKAKMNTHG